MIDEQVELDTARQALPIFPLPSTVLLPGAVLPLHVFEPRYRALVDYALAHERIFAIATLKPGYEVDYEGRPPVWPSIGIGRIVAHQALPDGRSNLVLRFLARARIVRELPGDRPFRQVQADLAIDQPPSDAVAYERVRSLIRQIGHYSHEAQAEATRLLTLEGSELVDALARKLLERVDDQLAYLREDRLAVRAQLVEGALAEVLASAVPNTVGEA